ncbi:hypothetical protein P879_04374 [Paragonimus westermani]|uniref:cGMP-dependent protein kinase interacting domain-containing protein n=1 Tax=Paragonimus westermani TaxID=34504 RepID=A0A8T0D8L8_9TREM|nr:hypothetical protein P879_04374 [Paragonimus westermani]
MQLKKVDPDQVRQTEAQLLLRDAKHWLEIGRCEYVVDPRTGASPLHVAACKDYTDVLEVLLKIPGLDLDCQDHDGWTALHAAAHWNHEQSVRLLVDAGASFDVYTFTNQSVLDVADQEMTPLLRQLRERQRATKRNAPTVPKPTLANIQSSKTIISDDASDASNEHSVDESTDEETTDNSEEEVEEEKKSTITKPNTVATPMTLSNDLPVKTVTTAAAGDGLKLINRIPHPPEVCEISEVSSLPREQKKLTEDTEQSISSRVTESSAFSASSNPVQTSPDKLDGSSAEQKTPKVARFGAEPKDSRYPESVKNENLPREPTPPTSPPDSIQSGVGKGPSLTNGLHKAAPTNPVIELKPETVSRPTFANGPRSTVSPLSPTSLSEPKSTDSISVVERTATSDRINAMRSLKASKEHSPPPPVPPTPLKGPTVNSNRIVTIRRRQIPPTPVDSQLITTLSSVDPNKGDKGNATAKPNEDNSNIRRVSLLMSPSKSAESETQRSIKARYVRSTRRSTQGVSAEEVEEAKKLIEKNNSAAVTSEASAVDGNDQVVSTAPSRSASDRSNLRATRATARSFFDQDLVEPERQPAWKPSTRPFDNSSAATPNTIAATPVADSALSSATPVIPIGKAVDSLKVYRGYPNETSAAHRTNSFGNKNSNPLSPSPLLSSEAAVEPASGGYLVSDSRRAHQSQPRGTRDWTANAGVFQSSDVDRPYSRRPVACTKTTAPNSGDYTSPYYGTVSHASPPITPSAVLTNDVNATAPVIPRTTDYRRLYEREKVEKERLARELDRINRENTNLRLQLSRLRADDDTHTPETVAPIPNDKSSIVDEFPRVSRVRRFHIKGQNLKRQLEELNRLREENAKMKEENGALIRVISKLSKPT